MAEHKNTKHFIILTSCSNISLAKENYENKSKVNKTKAMSAKNTQLGKDNLFKKVMLYQLYIHRQCNKFELLLYLEN